MADHIRDYEVIMLDAPLVGEDLTWPADPEGALLKCFMKHGDLYRQVTFNIKRSEVGTKEFILLIVEGFLILHHSMQEAK